MKTHEIKLNGYRAGYEGILYLGTEESYGNERLHLTLDEDWAALTITAIFTNNSSTAVIADSDGFVAVPPEAIAESTSGKPGRIVFKGTAEGIQRISTDLFYAVTRHAPINGSNSVTPTPDQYTQFVNEVREAADRAEAAADCSEGTVDPDLIKDSIAEYLKENNVQSITLDATLTKSGQAADAKAVGDALAEISTVSGEDGATFTPEVSEDGILSWTNDKGLLNPHPVKIKGEKGEKGDTGEQGPQGAKGEAGAAGISPAVSVEPITGGHRVTITDANNTYVFDVMDGEDGSTENSDGSGADGEDGVGIASVVQTTTSAEDGGSNVITVTLTNGTRSAFTVKNGSRGSAGADGYTPIRGTDYWTADDIAAIKTYVDEAILGGTW